MKEEEKEEEDEEGGAMAGSGQPGANSEEAVVDHDTLQHSLALSQRLSVDAISKSVWVHLLL